MKTRESAGTMDVWRSAATVLLGLAICLGWAAAQAEAQTGGEAGIQGIIQDQTGAVVPSATITLTNNETHLVTTRTATDEGVYNISPIPHGTYTVKVYAKGFAEHVQENVVLDALKMTPLDIVLKPGSISEIITVTDMPPSLETNNATLGGVIENKFYNNLPILMSGQQRDPTAFATFAARRAKRIARSCDRRHFQLHGGTLSGWSTGNRFDPAG